MVILYHQNAIIAKIAQKLEPEAKEVDIPLDKKLPKLHKLNNDNPNLKSEIIIYKAITPSNIKALAVLK